ncbi:hypothetical protein BN135_1676 [Cronobacter muytjensii 530]
MVDAITAHGGRAFPVQADISDERQVMAMFATLDQQDEPLVALGPNA